MSDQRLVALTVRQPWAWAIVHGYKDVENRTWTTSYRGRLLIHASRNDDSKGFETLRRRRIRLDDDTLVRGAIIGSVELVEIVDDSRSPWAHRGQRHWQLDDPHVYGHPIPCRGYPGHCWVPRPVDVLEMAHRQERKRVR